MFSMSVSYDSRTIKSKVNSEGWDAEFVEKQLNLAKSYTGRQMSL